MCFQVTKSIVALLQHYAWKKFSIVAENSPRWQTVADSLEARVTANNTMKINHRLKFEDMNRCCANRESCCHNSWTFDILEKTRLGTRSEHFYLVIESHIFKARAFKGSTPFIITAACFLCQRPLTSLFRNDYQIWPCLNIRTIWEFWSSPTPLFFLSSQKEKET